MIYISLIYSGATSYLNCVNVYIFASFAFYYSYCYIPEALKSESLKSEALKSEETLKAEALKSEALKRAAWRLFESRHL